MSYILKKPWSVAKYKDQMPCSDLQAHFTHPFSEYGTIEDEKMQDIAYKKGPPKNVACLMSALLRAQSDVMVGVITPGSDTRGKGG